MSKRYRILPYRQGSKGARALADALGGKVLKLEGSKFKAKTDDVVINWGNTYCDATTLPCFFSASFDFLNIPVFITGASNKLKFFQSLVEGTEDDGDIIPDFWTNKGNIPDDKYPIVCRTVLAGHSGAGIVIANSPGELVDAPLYVQYVKKKDEYRIHIGRLPSGDATVISVQRKARRHDTPDDQVNWQVRNHSNGFVFVRNNVTPPPSVLEVAERALLRTGLDFGAVDVIWNEQQGKAYVLEINTAPGLEGTTVEDYKTFFQSL
jgi:hypothetical protein